MIGLAAFGVGRPLPLDGVDQLCGLAIDRDPRQLLQQRHQRARFEPRQPVRLRHWPDFFTGPYLEDLPRALGNRLRGEFERLAMAEAQAEVVRRQEIARQEAEQRTRLDQAERALVLLREKMYHCTTGQILQLVGSAETAEAPATA